MADHSRRTFLRSASIGAAVAGTAVALPAVSAGAATPPREATGPTHSGPFVAWVKNVHSGDVVVLVDDQEVVLHDPALARRLAALAATARTS